MEDLETQEKHILNGWKELEDKKEIIELKEVCVWENECNNRLRIHLPSYTCVCLCDNNKAEKAQLIGVPDQILKEIESKHSKKE